MVKYQRILFICTGNFYRSRFAEALFNYHADALDLDWRAFSRGLRIHMAEGDLSPLIRDRLRLRNIPPRLTAPSRQTLWENDLVTASKVIALNRAEHLPMMQERFPAWASRIDYWDIHDIEVDPPEKTLQEIEDRVDALVAAFTGGCAQGSSRNSALEH